LQYFLLFITKLFVSFISLFHLHKRVNHLLEVQYLSFSKINLNLNFLSPHSINILNKKILEIIL